MSLPPRKVALRGDALLDAPEFNKGTAHTAEERRQFQLTSRLPQGINDLEEQCKRAKQQLDGLETGLEKNQFLWSLYAQNWTLFFGVLARNLTELMPIIYTPTEADAIAKFSHVFRRPLGAVFLSFPLQDSLEADFRSHLRDLKGRRREIDLVVVSDGEAILGIGDQGAGATGIATAKSVLYSLIAGINPARTLAVALDVGTDNQGLLDDDMYIGWRSKRVRGADYYKFVERFVSAVKAEFGAGMLLHFEDFGVTNAKTLLDKYKDDRICFNDDIQGTGAVTLAALYSALKVTGGKLEEQRIVCFGAGSAGLGIASQIRDAMVLDSDIAKEDANNNFFMIDKDGLLTDKTKDVRDGLKDFVRHDWNAGTSLEDVVAAAKPTVLIGTSTAAGAFSEKAIREMKKHCDQPIIFPLSNPTKLVECQPEDARKWTDNRALLSTGSPFDPVGDYTVAECNNALVYPGIGLGAIVAKAERVSDRLIVAAAKQLAELSPASKDKPNAALLPDFADSREVNFKLAVAVLNAAIDEGIAGVDVPKDKREEHVRSFQWTPEYRELVYDEDGEL